MSQQDSGALTRGALAKQSGVHPETLRYYERRGLLPEPERSRGNYRLYPATALERVRFVKGAQQLGFSLDDVRTLLAIQDGGRRADVRAKARAKLEEVEEKLRELSALRDELARLIEACPGGDAGGCSILDAIQRPSPAGAGAIGHLKRRTRDRSR